MNFIFTRGFWTFRLHFGSSKFAFISCSLRHFWRNHILSDMFLYNTLWTGLTIFSFFRIFPFASLFSTSFWLIRLVSNSCLLLLLQNFFKFFAEFPPFVRWHGNVIFYVLQLIRKFKIFQLKLTYVMTKFFYPLFSQPFFVKKFFVFLLSSDFPRFVFIYFIL